jgi:hypothetical protein
MKRPGGEWMVPALGRPPRNLKEAEKLIRDRERAGAVMSHQLGTLYAHVMNEELYMEAGFGDFWGWVEERMGRTRPYVRKLISMVSTFPDEKEVSKIGSRNARIIASVDDSRLRKRLVDAAKKGAPTKVIETRVRAFRQRERELKTADRPGRKQKRLGRMPKYIEVEKLLRFRRTLTLGKPAKLVEGLNVEIVQVGRGQFRLKFVHPR